MTFLIKQYNRFQNEVTMLMSLKCLLHNQFLCSECFEGVSICCHLALHKGSIWKCVSHALLIHNCNPNVSNSSSFSLSWSTYDSKVSQCLCLCVSRASGFTSHLSCLSITCCQPAVQFMASVHTQTHSYTCPGSPEHDTVWLSTVVKKGTGIKFCQACQCSFWLLFLLPALHTAAAQCWLLMWWIFRVKSSGWKSVEIFYVSKTCNTIVKKVLFFKVVLR